MRSSLHVFKNFCPGHLITIQQNNGAHLHNPDKNFIKNSTSPYVLDSLLLSSSLLTVQSRCLDLPSSYLDLFGPEGTDYICKRICPGHLNTIQQNNGAHLHNPDKKFRQKCLFCLLSRFSPTI